MNTDTDTLHAYIKLVAPEVINLATAKTEAEFCAVFDQLMERAVEHLEKNAANFRKLDEVGMSAVLAAFFNGMPGMTMIQEGHSNGHVDLTIEVRLASPIQRRLAEAKIEKGSAEHIKGLEQLLTRYVTGRDSTSWLILYVKRSDIKKRMANLQANMDAKLPLAQIAKCSSHAIKWAFVSAHKHSSGEAVQVTHIGCNLHHP